ncbi:MAG: hypothetical protein AAGE52_11605 [Myxococcota bacterium]
MRRLAWVIVLGAAVGCGDDSRGGGGRDGGSRDATTGPCSTDEDCNDGQECTIDSCGVGGECRFNPINERCPGEQICEPVRGCVDEPSCTSDAECDDGFECTLDSCGVGGECRNMPLDELCASVGPGSTCNPSTGMAGSGCTEATGCERDEDCDDGVECTLDACGVDMMCDFTPVNERCGDGEVCTATGCFESTPCEVDDDCQDGIFCNGREICEPEFGCQPAPEPATCNDSDDCTVDSCDTTADMCVFRCDGSMPSCDCPMDVPCDGIFDITPAPMFSCAFGQVAYNIREVEFSCDAETVQVNARNLPNVSRNTFLTQDPRSSDGSFDVQSFIGGGCEERYRLVGSFTGPDTFTAMFTAEFINRSMLGIDECMLGMCFNQSIEVTGTRR